MTKVDKNVILRAMNKKKVTAILLILLAFVAYLAVSPAYFNRGVDFVNESLRLSLPKIEERDFQLGLDLQGGAYLLYEADLSDIEEEEVSSHMEALRNLIERRIDIFGIGEPVVQIKGDRLVVELPGVHDLEKAIEKIGETPFLDFREIPEGAEEERAEKIEEAEELIGKSFNQFTEEDLEILEEEGFDMETLLSETPYVITELTGRRLESASVDFEPTTNKPVISLAFDSEGAQLFEEITARNVGRPLATFLDGELLQEATVQEKISGGRAQITGDFSLEEARGIAQNLQAGALPVPIELISQQSIGPSLGEESLNLSIMAALWGFLAVSIFVVAVYRLPGVLSVISLLLYGLILLALFKSIPITLTLSGIAGFILSLGMAIDANILIFSRMREEIRKGSSFKESVDEGFRRAWPSIRDGNFTTLIVAVVFFFIATSFVRGFAVTLILGILVSMFSAMVVTRYLLSLFADSKLSKIKKLWI